MLSGYVKTSMSWSMQPLFAILAAGMVPLKVTEGVRMMVFGAGESMVGDRHCALATVIVMVLVDEPLTPCESDTAKTTTKEPAADGVPVSAEPRRARPGGSEPETLKLEHDSGADRSSADTASPTVRARVEPPNPSIGTAQAGGC